MRVGVENRREVALMAVLAVLLVFFVWRAFRASEVASGSTTPKGPASTTRSQPTIARAGRSSRKAPALPAARSLDPTLRTDLLKISEDREYTGGKRNIFAAHVEAPPPPPCDGTIDKKTGKCIPHPVVAQGPVCPGPDPRCGPPPPPPIPLKFYGFASKTGEQKKVFLASGDDVIVGAEGDLVLRRYRILKINNTSVEIEDILNNNKQTIPLTSS